MRGERCDCAPWRCWRRLLRSRRPGARPRVRPLTTFSEFCGYKTCSSVPTCDGLLEIVGSQTRWLGAPLHTQLTRPMHAWKLIYWEWCRIAEIQTGRVFVRCEAVLGSSGGGVLQLLDGSRNQVRWGFLCSPAHGLCCRFRCSSTAPLCPGACRQMLNPPTVTATSSFPQV